MRRLAILLAAVVLLLAACDPPTPLHDLRASGNGTPPASASHYMAGWYSNHFGQNGGCRDVYWAMNTDTKVAYPLGDKTMAGGRSDHGDAYAAANLPGGNYTINVWVSSPDCWWQYSLLSCPNKVCVGNW